MAVWAQIPSLILFSVSSLSSDSEAMVFLTYLHPLNLKIFQVN